MSEEQGQDKYVWGMAIDLDLCTGCQACVVACHAENNVPTVGLEETIRNRAMHWIWIERYWQEHPGQVTATFRTMLCQHCHAAPCEPVCPVYATYHDTNDGLNIQVYNRCIGIRYCGINCPYKVRYFNWFDPYVPEPLNEQLNPDVTVRRRGIMEKCTFCVQRIRRAREESRAEGVEFNTEAVEPACAQTCPTGALIFGNLDDPESEVARLFRSPRAEVLLAELGTDPAVTYLKRGESNVRTE
ncbi:MAG TPA: 4Fe-4S dicluster domain-containing protein [Anaerolineae bacterium]|nr:4Fe-4S dicluster domain-containing protein [Anaerolineae bacterium]